MSNSDWRSYSAVGGWIVAAILAVAIIINANIGDDTAHNEHEYSQTEIGAGSYRQTSQEKLQNPRIYEPHCEAPESPEEANLCAQRTMAEAGSKAAILTRWQMWIGAGGLVALVITLLINIAATRAAIQTVKQGKRGYLFVKHFTFHRATWATPTEPEIRGFFIKPIIENASDAPAISTSIHLVTRVPTPGDTSPIDWTETTPAPRDEYVHVGPHQHLALNDFVINVHSAGMVFRNELRVLYMTKIRYRDLFDPESGYHTDQCFELSVTRDPAQLHADSSLSVAQYMTLTAVGKYGSAS